MVICIKCGADTDHMAHGLCGECYGKKWRDDNKEYMVAYRKKNHTKLLEYRRKLRGGVAMEKNKKCALWLGVYITERVLAKVFKNVKRMPTNNPGYDFICGKGFKIDVKSSCINKYEGCSDRWSFHISHNIIPDYFLCLAFDDRENLTPLHMWLIPGERVNTRSIIGVSETTVGKWSEYELDVNNVVEECLKMSGG